MLLSQKGNLIINTQEFLLIILAIFFQTSKRQDVDVEILLQQQFQKSHVWQLVIVTPIFTRCRLDVPTIVSRLSSRHDKEGNQKESKRKNDCKGLGVCQSWCRQQYGIYYKFLYSVNCQLCFTSGFDVVIYCFYYFSTLNQLQNILKACTHWIGSPKQ